MTRERAIEVLKLIYQQTMNRVIREGYEDDWMAAEAIRFAIREMEEGGDSKND